MNLIVGVFEALNQLTEVRNWNFKFLSIVTLIVSEIVDFQGLLKKLRDLPVATLAGEVMNLSASAISMHI